MRSSPPLTFRSTPDAVYLVGSAAGPLGGDSLAVTVEVADGASVTVRSAAATVALPGVGGEVSTMTVDLEVGARASLRWIPEPLVVAARADHRMTTYVRLGEGASLVLHDDVVLGRHGEPGGSLQHRLRVDVGGRPLLRNDLRLGPAWPAAAGPAGAAGARRLRQTLVVDGGDQRAVRARLPRARRAVMDLGDGAALVCEIEVDVEVDVGATRTPTARPR